MNALFLAMLLGQTGDAPKNIYAFTVKDIDGKTVPLRHYKGKVLLVVNVASFCGNTPQYKGLEELYTQKRRKGLVVLGFPANDFGSQEPNAEPVIKQFCTSTYHVTFPMFSKLSVKGADQAPLYHWLVTNSDRPTQDVEWNFGKFLIGRDGKVVARFSPKTTVEEPEVQAAISKALERHG